MQLTPQLLHAALEIAFDAGAHLIRFYHQPLQVQTKSDNTPVTQADLFVSRFLSEKLTALTPQFPVLSEESCDIPLAVRNRWQTYWLIDPLDGTQQFIRRTDQFSVLIALVHQNRPVLGIIHSPTLGKTYYAMQGFGAYKQTAEQTRRLQPRRLDPTRPLNIIVGSAAAAEKVRSILNPNFHYEFQLYGSSGLKSALVAEGVADCYIRLGQTGEWDTAAAEILLAESGGIIYDTRFRPLTYNQRESLINPDFIMGGDRQFHWEKIFRFNSP
ncbi:3'(2'),5'-bisphosphate nucleotidase CysQ [Caviibacterium pharyngocola]|uniref:3'(2'),5'-bisphosphate nucleotidase CysQ n=1 Tax=Caviibacterium pharyngocola TaxID=28159 RepID=A0A2M8RTZ3_9PAST|nr:3'(2'),5'-bisphosphate nucleotidase CysQ [Caviibacterium pharyngocola]PJG82357.1 3'(2'),5'-bisphosphate nucleotidase [Caviibacterium pharyngocola]